MVASEPILISPGVPIAGGFYITWRAAIAASADFYQLRDASIWASLNSVLRPHFSRQPAMGFVVGQSVVG
jgi:hypothetical protein